MGEGPETEGAIGREGGCRLQSRRKRDNARILVPAQFTTTVVSCRPAELQTDASGGKKDVLSGFHVVLEDTLLFPEGGGQVLGAASARPPPRNPPTFQFAPAEKCARPFSTSVNPETLVQCIIHSAYAYVGRTQAVCHIPGAEEKPNKTVPLNTRGVLIADNPVCQV